MTIEVTTANGDVVKVRLVKGKPVADIDALRKYHREYYHLNKQECEREHCNTKFTSQSALVRHQRRNQKCALIRVQAELEMLRNGQVTENICDKAIDAANSRTHCRRNCGCNVQQAHPQQA